MNSASAPSARSYTILLVDDAPANLVLAISHLEDRGFQIASAQDGEEALERAELVQPDLILLDVLMPGMDGFETCRRLKASNVTKDIPVIFMTALTETADKVTGFEAGGIDYITKPFDINEVVVRANTHLAMHAMRKEIEAKNARLHQEVTTRQQAEAALQLAHSELERRVAERTVELAEANAILKQEITERKRAETALRQSQNLLQAIIDNSTAVIFVKDVEGRYLLVNRRYEELFHVTKESIIGRTDYHLFPREAADAFRAFDRRVLEARKALEADEVVPQDDGIHTYIAIKCPLYDAEGNPYAVCGISTDITDRKRSEQEREALLASEQAACSKARDADRLKDEFLATLSHELRTPLTAIVGWAQLLSKGTLDAATMQRGCDVIVRNSWAELRIVEDLLDVSAIIRGKMALELQPVCLASVIEEVLDRLKLSAEAKRVCISRSLDSRAIQVCGDFNRLQQVVSNLVSNAIKFTPPGGHVHASLQEVGTTARIRISDTGEGISAEFLPHMFERFRQADSSTKRRRGGLGLGLSIVRHIVEIHDGTVRGESAGEGQGTTLIVDLPLMPSVEALNAPRSAGAKERDEGSFSSTLAGLRILVVEDESDVRDLITRMLAGADAEVRGAAMAREGFEMFEQWRPDVIVSDIGLPDEDGYALIRWIRALPIDRGGQTPAAALTAYADQNARQETLSAGYQVHVSKPVDPTELMDVIVGLAGRGRLDLVCP